MLNSEGTEDAQLQKYSSKLFFLVMQNGRQGMLSMNSFKPTRDVTILNASAHEEGTTSPSEGKDI